MPVHVEELRSEVSVLAGDVPLSQAQLEQIADLVAARIEARGGAGPSGGGDTSIRPAAVDPGPVEA